MTNYDIVHGLIVREHLMFLVWNMLFLVMKIILKCYMLSQRYAYMKLQTYSDLRPRNSDNHLIYCKLF